MWLLVCVVFFQAEDGIRDLVRSRGLGDVYKRQVHHLVGTAAGWGGLPDAEATYVGVAPGLPVGEYELTVGPDVPVNGFWSISVYNADGFFEPNERGAYSVNNITARHNDDGGITVRFLSLIHI